MSLLWNSSITTTYDHFKSALTSLQYSVPLMKPCFYQYSYDEVISSPIEQQHCFKCGAALRRHGMFTLMIILNSNALGMKLLF